MLIVAIDTLTKENIMKYDRKLINNIHAMSDLIPKQMYKDKPLKLENLSRMKESKNIFSKVSLE